jgi:hypothetical protein
VRCARRSFRGDPASSHRAATPGAAGARPRRRRALPPMSPPPKDRADEPERRPSSSFMCLSEPGWLIADPVHAFEGAGAAGPPRRDPRPSAATDAASGPWCSQVRDGSSLNSAFLFSSRTTVIDRLPGAITEGAGEIVHRRLLEAVACRNTPRGGVEDRAAPRRRGIEIDRGPRSSPPAARCFAACFRRTRRRVSFAGSSQSRVPLPPPPPILPGLSRSGKAGAGAPFAA